MLATPSNAPLFSTWFAKHLDVVIKAEGILFCFGAVFVTVEVILQELFLKHLNMRAIS